MTHIGTIIKKSGLNKKFKALEKKQKKQNKEIATEDGKCFGECEACGFETVLVEAVGMCGPCTFGEAETLNGNW